MSLLWSEDTRAYQYDVKRIETETEKQMQKVNNHKKSKILAVQLFCQITETLDILCIASVYREIWIFQVLFHMSCGFQSLISKR